EVTGDDLPPAFKEHMKQTDAKFRTLNAAMSELGAGLKKFFEQEGQEPEHAGDDEEEMVVGDDEEEVVTDALPSGVPSKNDTKEILGELEFEAPVGTGDCARRAKDSVYLGDSFQDTLAKAEVLAPGIALPTFDVKAAPKRTLDSIIKLRKTALDLAYAR